MARVSCVQTLPATVHWWDFSDHHIRLFLISLGVSHSRIPVNDTISSWQRPQTVRSLQTLLVCRTVRGEWFWGQPVSFHSSRASENRKLLGRGKLPSCWPHRLHPPGLYEPAVLNITAACRLLLLIHCGQSMNLNAAQHQHLSGLLYCALV